MKIENQNRCELLDGINWITLMGQQNRWNLAELEIFQLLAMRDIDELINVRNKLESGLPIAVQPETMERIDLLLQIHKQLLSSVPSQRPELAYEWFNKPNYGKLLGGRSIKDYLLKNNNIQAFHNVCNYLPGDGLYV